MCLKKMHRSVILLVHPDKCIFYISISVHYQRNNKTEDPFSFKKTVKCLVILCPCIIMNKGKQIIPFPLMASNANRSIKFCPFSLCNSHGKRSPVKDYAKRRNEKLLREYCAEPKTLIHMYQGLFRTLTFRNNQVKIWKLMHGQRV